jgi:hypothetical protein
MMSLKTYDETPAGGMSAAAGRGESARIATNRKGRFSSFKILFLDTGALLL